jgi:hypothetical protein
VFTDHVPGHLQLNSPQARKIFTPTSDGYRESLAIRLEGQVPQIYSPAELRAAPHSPA